MASDETDLDTKNGVHRSFSSEHKNDSEVIEKVFYRYCLSEERDNWDGMGRDNSGWGMGSF